MRRGAITVAIFVTAAIVVGANWVLGRAAANSVPRQIIRRIDSAGPVISVLGIGNSLMEAGFDSTSIQNTFQRAGESIVAVNAGIGSTPAVEHLALTRRALRHHRVRDLIYGFADQQLSTQAPLKNSELIGNYAMLYYLEPKLALQYNHFDLLNRLEFEVYRQSTLLRERGNIWAKVEKMRRAMQAQGMPREESNQFGRRADFNLLEAKDGNEFAQRCRNVMRTGDFLSPALQELFREAETAGTRITVVEMPMSPSHVAKFYEQATWDEFVMESRQTVERFGGIYIDASRWIAEEGEFQDHLHLSRSGAERFSRLLGEDLLRRQGIER